MIPLKSDRTFQIILSGYSSIGTTKVKIAGIGYIEVDAFLPTTETKSLTFTASTNWITTSAFTSVPGNANAIIATVFVYSKKTSADDKGNDHFNVIMGDNPTTSTTWVGPAGLPTDFTNINTLGTRAVAITMNGESDGYAPYYGVLK